MKNVTSELRAFAEKGTHVNGCQHLYHPNSTLQLCQVL